jgi:rRNA-processing protein FCF1
MAELNVRRAVIREWMSLAREKRQSGEQALAFAKAAIERHKLPRRRRPAEDVVLGWLKPRTGRP